MEILKRETTYTDTFNQFINRSKSASFRLNSWLNDVHHKAVIPFVQSHVTKALYKITRTQIEETCRNTIHALGNVQKKSIEKLNVVRDWHPSFAFIHIFHYSIERLGQMPTYQYFRQMSQEDDFLRKAILEPSNHIYNYAISLGYEPQKVKDAIRWRVGNAYYSALREVYTLACLREFGLDLRYHVLADALLAIDCWIGDVVISLYVKNNFFKDNFGGRKWTAQSVLSDAHPPFKYLRLPLEPADKFGVVHLPSRNDISKLADKITSII